MARGDDRRRGVRIVGSILLVGAGLGLLGLALLATAASATGAHRARRMHPSRTTVETRLTTYSGNWGPQLVVVQKGQKLALFDFSQDSPGKSACYGRCQKVWYPLLAHGKIVVKGSGINKRQLKTFRRKNGSRQIEYYGEPLYRCHKNTKAGQKYGANAYQFGGSWGLMGAQGSALQSGHYGGGKPVPGC